MKNLNITFSFILLLNLFNANLHAETKFKLDLNYGDQIIVGLIHLKKIPFEKFKLKVDESLKIISNELNLTFTYDINGFDHINEFNKKNNENIRFRFLISLSEQFKYNELERKYLGSE